MRKFKAVYAKQYPKQDGTNGTSWKTVGFANEVISQEGKTTIHLTLDSIPTGNWDGDIKLFLQDENQNNSNGGGYQQQQQAYQQPSTTYENNQGQQVSQQQYNQQQGHKQ